MYELRVIYWSRDERRAYVRCLRNGVEMYTQWETVRYDPDGRGWAEGPAGWVCVFS